MIIHKCDKCGELAEQEPGQYVHTPSTWRLIRYTVFESRIEYEVCGDCAEKLGISKCEDTSRTIGERLIELLTEIVQDASDQ